jgi:hypothetical protein
MINKVAPLFWLGLSVGMIIALFWGNPARWLTLGSVVGIAWGLALWARAMRRRRALHLGRRPAIPLRARKDQKRSELNQAA